MSKFTTTLNQIRAHHPCTAGWQKLLSHLGKTKADDEPLSLLTILESNGLDDALWAARAIKGHDRDFRLFAVWAARQVQHLMTDERSLAALDVAERFADGEATEKDLAAASAAASAAAWEAVRRAWASARDAASAAASAAARDAARDAAREAARDAWAAARDAEVAASAAQANRLRQMVEDGGWVGSTQPTPMPAAGQVVAAEVEPNFATLTGKGLAQ